MNLLCPNCQKMLTVPEQFAGQVMGCPLCSGKFTVPALPMTESSAPAFAASTPSPPEPPPAPPSSEPLPAFSAPSPPVAPANPTYNLAPPEPAFAVSSPAPPTAPASAPASPSPAPAPAPAPAPTPAPTKAATSPASSGGYAISIRLAASERILRWVPPAAIVLIFFLQFFPWVGVFPGGVPALTQDAWDAAFGWSKPDLDMKSQLSILEDESRKTTDGEKKETSVYLGVSLLTLFYLFPFFVVTLIVSIFVVVQPFLNLQLPPQIQQVMPFKWAILTGLNAVLLLFLGLQMLLSFDLESRARAGIDSKAEIKREPKDNKDKKLIDVERGRYLEWLKRTSWLRLVLFLHIVATLSAALIYWMERRGPNKPAPCVEFHW
jgi:hypothetical protein